MLQGLTDGVAECLRKARLSLSEIDLVIGEQSAPETMQTEIGSLFTREGRGLPAPPAVTRSHGDGRSGGPEGKFVQ